MYQRRAHFGIRRVIARAPDGGSHDQPGRSPFGASHVPGERSSRTPQRPDTPSDPGGLNSKDFEPGRRQPPYQRLAIDVDHGLSRSRNQLSKRVMRRIPSLIQP